MSNSCFSTFSWLADCKASAIAEGSIGKMNAVFPPWPIREFRDRSDGIPESGRKDSIFRGAGAFFGILGGRDRKSNSQRKVARLAACAAGYLKARIPQPNAATLGDKVPSAELLR